MVHWNADGFKMGLCDVAGADQSKSLLCLSNNCCVAGTFKEFEQRFQKLYRRKAMLHHYESFLGKDEARSVFEEAKENLGSLITAYQDLDHQVPVSSSAAVRHVPFV